MGNFLLNLMDLCVFSSSNFTCIKNINKKIEDKKTKIQDSDHKILLFFIHVSINKTLEQHLTSNDLKYGGQVNF